MRFHLTMCVTVWLVIGFLACEGKKRKDVLNVLTYNTWLQESLPNVYSTKEDRKKKIIRSLKKSSADLVCLQEAWIGSDVEDIVNNVQGQFPYSFSGIHTNINEFPPQSDGKRFPPCDYARVDAYVKCSVTNGCNNLPDASEAVTCAVSNCFTELMDIFQQESQGCLNCMTLSALNLYKCAALRKVGGGRQMNNAGLVLLSKKSLRDAAYVDYHPTAKTLVSRGYIKAEIKDYATVFCTHMSATNALFFEPGLESEGFTSYAYVHAHQTRTLIRSLRGIQPAIILGDFNTGLALKSQQQPEVQESYIMMLKRFTTRPSVDFTWRNPKDKSKQSIVDHVFVKNMLIRKTKRVFLPRRGKTPMSDHVGVQSVVKLA